MNSVGIDNPDSMDNSEKPELTIKSLYNEKSSFYDRHNIQLDEDIRTYTKNLKNIDNLFCKSFKEYIQNTKRDLKNNEIYAIIFKAIQNIQILIKQLNNFFDKQKNKKIFVLAIQDYKSFYKLLRLLQITYFNSTSCSSNISNFNNINIETYKKQFLKFVLTIISDELLYCSILTKLHIPLLIYKINKTTYETTKNLIANNFNDVVCFKDTAEPDSFPILNKILSYGKKLPVYDNLDFINYRYDLSADKINLQAADLSNVIILNNDLLSNDTKYFVNVITIDNLDRININEINNNFKFVDQDDKKYMEYSETKPKNEYFNYGDILLYTCVILTNESKIFKFSKVDYDSRFETADLDKPITFADLFSDNDKNTCKIMKDDLNNNAYSAVKIVYVVLRKFLWTLNSPNETNIAKIIYSNNFYLERKNPDSIFKKIKYINAPDENINIGDFFDVKTNEVLRIPKYNIPINHEYAPSFNNEKRKIINDKYSNVSGSEITDIEDSEKINLNKKIDVSELLTCENVKEDDNKYMEYLKFPSNDKIMYEVYKTYHFHNSIKKYKYNDKFTIDTGLKQEKILLSKYKPTICNNNEENQLDMLYNDNTPYKNHIMELLKRDSVQNLINNKQEEEKSVMTRLLAAFSKSINNKSKKLGEKSKGQGNQDQFYEGARIAVEVGKQKARSVMNSLPSMFRMRGGDSRKNKINKKDKSIKNHLKQRKQNNKKRKFMNNKPLNIKITIKNN